MTFLFIIASPVTLILYVSSTPCKISPEFLFHADDGGHPRTCHAVSELFLNDWCIPNKVIEERKLLKLDIHRSLSPRHHRSSSNCAASSLF
jgi:hypothetical protein